MNPMKANEIQQTGYYWWSGGYIPQAGYLWTPRVISILTYCTNGEFEVGMQLAGSERIWPLRTISGNFHGPLQIPYQVISHQ